MHLVALRKYLLIHRLFVLTAFMFFMKNQSQRGTKPLGSKVDLHYSMCDGVIGSIFFFVKFINDFSLNAIPIIMETPDNSRWPKEVIWLRSQIN